MLDLLVIGGGPTGLATAIYAAHQGLRVRVLEPAAGPIDKACGEGLMPSAVRDLEDLVPTMPAGHPFVGIRYLQGGAIAEARFAGGNGLGVRRTALHRALADGALAAGVDRVSHRARELCVTDEGVDVDGMQARWLVAADGLRSPTRTALGLQATTSWPARIGLRRHWQVTPWSDMVEVWWSPHAEAYVTPVAPDQVGVAFLARQTPDGPGTPWDRLMEGFPGLRDRLAGASPASTLAGAGPFAVASSRRTAGRAMLVGDAAGYLDPITGEGVRLGFCQARAAVDAIVAQDPAAYERAWWSVWRPYAFATGALLRLTTPAWSRSLLVPTLQRAPFLMRAVLSHLAA